MSAPPDSSVPPLLRHLDVLYPLAQVLAGPDEAASLLQQVYERAAEVPSEERPDAPQPWLFGLLVEAHGSSPDPSSEEGKRSSETSLSDDPFRRDIARQTAERALPIAFAACSRQERLLLTLDVLSAPSDDILATALRTSPATARSMCDEAHSALRAALRDVLTGPERMLVDVALPDETLQETLHDFLVERFQSAPSSLRSSVHRILEEARAERTQDTAPSQSQPSFFDWLGSQRLSLPSARHVFIVLAVLAMLAGGIAGVLWMSQSTPEPPPNVVELSVRQADTIQADLATNDFSEAEQYVLSTWNRRISVPTIEQAQFRGVGRLQVSDAEEVPVFLYTDTADSTRISAFAYSYALLDQLGSEADLAADLRNQLARNEHLIAQRHAERGVVLWRHRDDIFVTVASSDSPQSLRERIRP